MPTKRVVVHVSCAACGTGLPLDSVVTSVGCVVCSQTVHIGSLRWRWVLDEPARTAAPGEQISGETTEAGAACACGAEIPERAISGAFATRAISIPCASCGGTTPFRALDKGFSSAESGVLGEGRTTRGAPSPIDTPCSNCGAPLTADGSTQTPTCAFCGTRTTLPDDVWRALRLGNVFPFTIWTSRFVARDAGASKVGGVVALGVVAVLLLGAGGAFFATRTGSPSGFGTIDGPCNGMEHACSTDKKWELRCDGDKFVRALPCKGPKGCRLADDGKSTSCDYTFADPGDPCNVEDDACSTDRRAVVHCDRSSFTVSMTCKGPDGCTITPHDKGATLSCDDHVAASGDLCKGDHWACAADMKSALLCKDGRFVSLGTCGGPTGCTISKNPAGGTTTIACDSTVANVGDLCQGRDPACSSDGKSMLRCENAHFVAAERCAGGCTVAGDRIQCRSRTGR